MCVVSYVTLPKDNQREESALDDEWQVVGVGVESIIGWSWFCGVTANDCGNVFVQQCD